MTDITNFTFDEITIGQSAHYSKRIEDQDILLFAVLSGDVNPVHLDDTFAAASPFKERIAHGMLTGAIVSAALAMELPGPGTVYLGQSLRFRRPVTIGDTIRVQLTVTEKRDKRRVVSLDCQVTNQQQKTVADGIAEVMAPTDKLRVPRPSLPEIALAAP
ncbi:MAG: MaoC/PaaZ C-terminal domain-containing protein [Pseudomonadota bacterium]